MKKSRRKNRKTQINLKKIVDIVSDLSEPMAMKLLIEKNKFQNNLKLRVKKLSELTGFSEELIMEASLLTALNNCPTLPSEGVVSERAGEPKLVREVLPEVVGVEELAPVMELVDDLELGLREPEEEGREYGAE